MHIVLAEPVTGLNSLLLGLIQHPFVATVVVGIVWPLIQASLDKPWWTRRRRVILLAAASVVLSLGIWLMGVYPWAWEMIATQTSMILGIAWSTYQVLAAVRINGVRLLDWVGILTPGGEAYEPKHAAGRQDASTE